jgi:GNAT superfamily N-acetyltransferase
MSAAAWRPMTPADLDAVCAVADIVHPAYPEDRAVFEDRLGLYPPGCMVLDRGGGLTAYVLSHPWRRGGPPRLNQRLAALPAGLDTYYIHDLALLPAARGAGAATRLVAMLVDHAAGNGFDSVSLVAVNDSAGFWRRCGFRPLPDPAIDQSLMSYDPAACYMVRDIPICPGA